MPSSTVQLALIAITIALRYDVVIAQLGTPPLCRPSGVIPPGQQQATIFPLNDRRINGSLPSTLPTSVLVAEGAAYYALYSTVLNVQSWAACPLQQQQQQQQFPAPKGWSVTKVVTINGIYKGKPANVPTLVVLQDTISSVLCTFGKRLSSSHLVMLLRGTMLASDWQYSYNYKLQEAPEYGPGLMHSGAVNATSQLWRNGVKQILDKAFEAGCVPAHITLAGHSLGGAGATLLSLRVAKYVQQKWAESRKQGDPPVITAVMFGAPAIGDARFAAEFNRHVNGRKLDYETDPYTSVFLKWTPDQSPPDPQYAIVGGLITFGAEAMAFQRPVWQQLGKTGLTSPFLATQLKQATGQAISGFDAWTGATHTCSYLWLNGKEIVENCSSTNIRVAAPVDISNSHRGAAMCFMCMSGGIAKAANNWCLLHRDTSGILGKSATYCANPNQVTEGNMFPTAPAYP